MLRQERRAEPVPQTPRNRAGGRDADLLREDCAGQVGKGAAPAVELQAARAELRDEAGKDRIDVRQVPSGPAQRNAVEAGGGRAHASPFSPNASSRCCREEAMLV